MHSSNLGRRLGWLALWLSPVALAAWVFLRFGRLGFNPTDEGYVLSQSARILDGEIPHRDLISPRPLGSAYLHVVDFVPPLPLLEASRLIALGEFVLFTALLASLAYRLPFRRWTPVHALAAGGAVLANLHGFPLMAWHTVDGLLLVAAGFVVLRAGLEHERRSNVLWGLALLGAAAVTKQSFAVAPLLGIAVIVWSRRAEAGVTLLRRTVPEIGAAAVPAAAYAAVVVAAGGLPEMITQFSHVRAATGKPLYSFLLSGTELSAWAQQRTLWAVVLLLLARSALPRVRAALPGLEEGLARLDVALRALFTAVVIDVVVREHLAMGGRWGLLLVWSLALYLVWRLVAERAFDAVGFLLLAVAWMASLSLGYPYPNLAAGSVALLLLQRTWEGVDATWLRTAAVRVASVGFAAAAFVLVTDVFAQERDSDPYRDLPRSSLTARLDDVSSEFGRIRTNPQTHEYLAQIRSCLDRHPARYVAILPDNAALYPIFGLHNPFPIDWMTAVEYAGSQERLVEAAERLDRRGDYLVLFETVSPSGAWQSDSLVRAPRLSLEEVFNSNVGRLIRQALSGRSIACGRFDAVYAPPAA